MSDPAKTPEEIEDVLASIRRLVSDAGPDKSAANSVEELQTPAAVAEDRLVLTPSFRVTDPEDPWIPVSNAAVEDVETPVAVDDADWQPEDRLARFDSVGGADDVAADLQDVSEDDIADLIHLDGASAVSADFESETGDDNWPSTGAEAALLTLVARRDPANADDKGDDPFVSEDAYTDPNTPITEAAEDASAVEEAFEGDEAEVEAEERAFAEALAAEALVKEALANDADEDPELAEETSDPELRSEIELVEDLEDEEEEAAAEPPSDAEEDATDQHDEDEPDRDDVAPVEEAVVEDVKPIPVFSARPDQDDVEDSIDDLGEDPSPFSFPDAEDSILDEETLREIIVDVVREELQGVLGQRITRNVRKMVRREVRLALAAEDLE